MTDRIAHAYLSLPVGARADAEQILRRHLAECARLEGFDLAGVFVDRREDQPYAFSALRDVVRRHHDGAVLLPGLSHVAHITAVGGLTVSGLSRYLGVPVLVCGPEAGGDP